MQLIGMQEADRLPDEADRLLSEANRLLGQTIQVKDDQGTRRPNDEKKTEISSEQGFWVNLAKIDVNEESIDEDVIPTRAEYQ